MPRKLKFYVRKNEHRLQTKPTGASNAPVSLYNEVAVQTESKTEPDMVDAEVQTDRPNLETEDVAQIDFQPVHRAEVEVQTDMEVMAPNEVCDNDDCSIEASDVEVTSNEFVCEGNSDEKFGPLVAKHKGIFRNVKGSVTAYYDYYKQTIRHVNCSYTITEAFKFRCPACQQFRDNYLRASLSHMMSRQEKEVDPCAASSHINFRFLNTPEKLQRMKNLAQVVHAKDKVIADLRKKADLVMKADSVTVDQSTHNDLLAIMSAQKDIGSSDNFSSIFWQQQLKVAKLSKKSGMRWHPAMIRWCLYLHHRSSGCYATLRNSGVITLPSERTLRDYRHCFSADFGFSASSDHQLCEAVKSQKPPNLAKYVTVVIDEMYIKAGLVFNKASGALVGFHDLGEVNNLLGDLERGLKHPNTRRPLAKVMLVFMVRGLFTAMKFPYVQFAAASTKGGTLFPLFRQVVCRLTRLGLCVVAVTCDGASDNRRLFSLHDTASKMVYKTRNVYSKEKDTIFFFSDPPHLIKTIRNCFQRGKLWCNGSPVDWQLVVELYKRNAGMCTDTPGLSIVPKIKYEHIYLTSFSKMRVDLAAQVLSSSVAAAIRLCGGEGAIETANFIEKMDKFFDCFNVSTFTAGKHQRKPFLEPYRSKTDFRLDFLKELTDYLDQWEDSVAKREEVTKEQKAQMILSRITDHGLRMTISSFLELLPRLFSIEGVTVFLSEKLNQDPLEKFFGCQRQRGRVNENPTAAEFVKNTQSLRVISSICVNNITGNCRGTKRKSYDLESGDLHNPLKKRSRKRNTSY